MLSGMNNKGSEGALCTVYCRCSTRKAKQKDALLQVILKEAVQTTKKQFASLPSAKDRTLNP